MCIGSGIRMWASLSGGRHYSVNHIGVPGERSSKLLKSTCKEVAKFMAFPQLH